MNCRDKPVADTDMERHGEIWRDMERHGETCRDVERERGGYRWRE